MEFVYSTITAYAFWFLWNLLWFSFWFSSES
jgi:hypothetical protein